MSTAYFEDDISSICVDGARVELSGEMDIRTLASLRRALLDATGVSEGSVSVDLRDVTFIDSASIGLLITAKRRAAQVGDRLVIVGYSAIVRRAFEIMGLLSVFGITPDPATPDPTTPDPTTPDPTTPDASAPDPG